MRESEDVDGRHKEEGKHGQEGKLKRKSDNR